MSRLRAPRTAIAAWLFAGMAFMAMAARAGSVGTDEWRDGPGYRTYVIGDESAPTPDPVVGGLLLNGGGGWPYDAFRWFTEHAGHGHLVVLRASGNTDIQDRFYNDIKGLKSVRTFVFSDRRGASDPRLLAAVRAADAIFVGGGDQSNYVRMWRGTPLNEAIDAHIAAGKPFGGTSAGLAIQGSWLYGCMDSVSLTSNHALADPLGRSVTIEGDFLHSALLEHILTDSHFDARARLGRLVTFVARAHSLDPERTLAGLGIDEAAALTVEADGTASFHARSGGKYAWLVQPRDYGALQPGRPLNLEAVRVTAIGPATTFNVHSMEVQAPAFEREYDVVDGELRLREPR
ncbi:MAG TPA: cyanophycinase [Steroidobacteraceae bacterium]|nr:cyanophycinase [Steroidobacteraceae bacterium]